MPPCSPTRRSRAAAPSAPSARHGACHIHAPDVQLTQLQPFRHSDAAQVCSLRLVHTSTDLTLPSARPAEPSGLRPGSIAWRDTLFCCERRRTTRARHRERFGHGHPDRSPNRRREPAPRVRLVFTAGACTALWTRPPKVLICVADRVEQVRAAPQLMHGAPGRPARSSAREQCQVQVRIFYMICLSSARRDG